MISESFLRLHVLMQEQEVQTECLPLEILLHSLMCVMYRLQS